MVGFHGHAVLHLDDWHVGERSEQTDHEALVRGIEVWNEHEGDAAVRRHGGEEFLEGVQPASRGADTGHNGAWEV